MSDLADQAAESCAVVENAGGQFVKTASPVRLNALPACACGSRPVYRNHPPLKSGGAQVETLGCQTCGNQVGPYQSRQQLATAWRLYGRIGK